MSRNGSAVSNSISSCVYQAILATYEQRSEWLSERFRTLQWPHEKFKTKFISNLTEELQKNEDQDALILRVIKILQNFLQPSFFLSPEFVQLINTIRDLIVPNEDSLFGNQEISEFSWSENSEIHSNAIAILLLDAENLQLDLEIEQFLAEICTYPIQIKIAFANWRNMGKHDVELHQRGYELIHVPAGKDSADVKMATVGSSIFIHYPNAKEVLVCSSDNVLTHLCTTLQTHGLTVYRVRKLGDILTVLNTKTGEITTHSLIPPLEIVSVEELSNQLKEIIKSEQKRTANHWVKLSRIGRLYQEKYRCNLAKVVDLHLPGKPESELFIQLPDFVVYQLPERSDIYVTFFENPAIISLEPTATDSQTPTQRQSRKKTEAIASNKKLSASHFSTKEQLECAFVELIESLRKKSYAYPIVVGILGAEFRKAYGQNPTEIIKRLGLGSNLSKFLKACSAFSVQKLNQDYQVAIASPELTISPTIHSPTDLEKILITLLKNLTENHPDRYIPISNLGSEFHKQYGEPITKIMRRLKLGSKFPKVLQAFDSLKLKQVEKTYHVAIASPNP